MELEQEIANEEEVVIADIDNEEEPEEVELGEDGQPVEKEEKEPWQLTEDEEEPEGGVPVDTHIRMKQKLKGRLKERDNELENLKAQIARLEKGPAESTELPPRPKAIDFDSDEEHEAALEKWDNQRLEIKLAEKEANRTTAQTTRQQEERIAKDVDKHYDRTAALAAESSISPDHFKEAEESFRQAVDTIMPGRGDGVTDYIISVLGEGSEKVLYFTGRNKAAKAEFQSLLAEDKTGSKALVYLGQQKERLTNPKRKTSSAPKPASTVKGDASLSQSEAALKKKYDAAHKKNNTQAAYNLKKQARKSGVDVSTW